MKPKFKIFNSTAMTSNLTLRERNQRDHRLDEIGKRTVELFEITGLDHIMLSFERSGITMHLAAEITEPNP